MKLAYPCCAVASPSFPPPDALYSLMGRHYHLSLGLLCCYPCSFRHLYLLLWGLTWVTCLIPVDISRLWVPALPEPLQLNDCFGRWTVNFFFFFLCLVKKNWEQRTRSWMENLSSSVLLTVRVSHPSRQNINHTEVFERTYPMSSIILELSSWELSGAAFPFARNLCISEKKTNFGLPTCG